MKRIVPGILLALCWFVLLYIGSPLVFASVMIPVAFLGADEYVKMVTGGRFSLSKRFFLAILLILPLIFTAIIPGTAGLAGGLVLAFSLLALYCFAIYDTYADSYDLFCRLVFGIVYLGVLGLIFWPYGFCRKEAHGC